VGERNPAALGRATSDNAVTARVGGSRQIRMPLPLALRARLTSQRSVPATLAPNVPQALTFGASAGQKGID